MKLGLQFSLTYNPIMKKLIIGILISFGFVNTSFAEICDEASNIQDRNGVLFLPNQTKPYSGESLCSFDNEQFKTKGRYNNGLKSGLWTEWQNNGIKVSEEIYIQSLADTLGRQMTLPEDMSVTLHYVDDNVQNAFATLGGHIYIHRGLLELMPNENALSMVIAHEIAHVQHRHPVIAMGRGVVIGLFLAAITGMNGDRFVGGLVNNAGVITVLGFSREQEREADQTALAAVEKHYGHVSGASDLFKAMLQLEESQILQAPQFFNTHPLSTERIAIIEQYAAENSWSIDAKTTPLSISLENPL